MASATMLLPGQGGRVDIIEPTDSSLIGNVLLSETVGASSVSDPAYGYGSVAVKVIQRADTGTLDFYFPGGTGPNSSFTVDGFAGASTDLYQLKAVLPEVNLGSEGNRSSGTGDEIIFGTALGSSDTPFLVRTSDTTLPDAQTLTLVQGSDVAGSEVLTSTYQLIGAAPGVSEPGTAPLLLIAVTALGLANYLKIASYLR
jgi:hypothetical protein